MQGSKTFTTDFYEDTLNEDPWNSVLQEAKERDNSRCDAWKYDIQSLLTFVSDPHTYWYPRGSIWC